MAKFWIKAPINIILLLVLASACIYFLTKPINTTSQNPSLVNPSLNCVIKGNISKTSNKKIYHLPGCDSYDKIKIKELKGERWFCSEIEAIQAGWSKSGKCP